MTLGTVRRRATLIGSTAIGMWGALALLTAWSGDVPPLQLVAMCFAIAFAGALVQWIANGENPLDQIGHSGPVWLFGVGGLFGYHVFYFLALRDAPAVEAGLIAYLWPLLIAFGKGDANWIVAARCWLPGICCDGDEFRRQDETAFLSERRFASGGRRPEGTGRCGYRASTLNPMVTAPIGLPVSGSATVNETRNW